MAPLNQPVSSELYDRSSCSSANYRQMSVLKCSLPNYFPVDNFGTVVGENPSCYGILLLWAVNGLSIVYWVSFPLGRRKKQRGQMTLLDVTRKHFEQCRIKIGIMKTSNHKTILFRCFVEHVTSILLGKNSTFLVVRRNE